MQKNKLLFVLALVLGVAYGLTLAPGLSWANNGTDGGDLISAAATAGIAHPSGYPLYLLLAGLFQHLPIGSLAFRTNLMSAVCTLLAAGVIFWLLEKKTGSPFSALVGALAFGLSPLAWSQAVITEVYGLHVLLVAGILFSILLPAQKPIQHFGQGLLFGIAVGNHLTTLFLAPLLLLQPIQVLQAHRSAPEVSYRVVGWISLRFLGVLTGLLVYLILPLRASAWPPLNWGHPVTLDNFFWLVSAQIYREYALSITALEILQRLQSLAGLFLHQFTFLGLALGLYGLFSKMSAATRVSTLWVFVSFSLFASLYAYSDSYIYVLPASIAFSIWMGVGVHDLLSVVSIRKQWLPPVLWGVFLVCIVLRSLYLLPELNASQDQRAEAFGQHLMAAAPQAAIVFTDSDEETFTLWYYHYALRERPDLNIISEGLLQFDWYCQTLQKTYPGLIIPDYGSFTTAQEIVDANLSRPICFATYQGIDTLACDEMISK